MISSSNLIGIAQSVQSPGGDAARNSRLLQTRSLIARPSPGKLGKKSGETCRNVSARIARRCVSVEKIFGCNARNKQSERAGEGIGANDTQPVDRAGPMPRAWQKGRRNGRLSAF